MPQWSLLVQPSFRLVRLAPCGGLSGIHRYRALGGYGRRSLSEQQGGLTPGLHRGLHLPDRLGGGVCRRRWQGWHGRFQRRYRYRHLGLQYLANLRGNQLRYRPLLQGEQLSLAPFWWVYPFLRSRSLILLWSLRSSSHSL